MDNPGRAHAAAGIAARRPALLIALGAGLALASSPAISDAQRPGYCESRGARTAARVGVGSGAVAGNAALYVYFHNAWWSGEKAEKFWINHDWDMAFRDQDKFGHLLGGYHLARLGTDLLSVGCLSRGQALAWGSVYGFLFQLQVEIWDGYQAKYGFSPPDLLANTLGTGLWVARETVPGFRYVKPTFSYVPTEAYRRRDEHPNSELRSTVDYSGQTYWFSADLDAMLPAAAKAYWPDLLRVSLGHTITDWVNPETGATMRAGRRILLSVDIDAAKLPGSHPVWVRIKEELSHYRLPAPAIQLWPNVKGIGWQW